MMKTVEQVKDMFYLICPRGEEFVVFARDAWEHIANDVKDEFDVEDIHDFHDFQKELYESANVKFLVKKNDGRIFSTFWSGWVKDEKTGTPFRALGCIVRDKGMSVKDKMLVANVSSPALDWFLETEPPHVKAVYVGIPEIFKRLNRHAREVCKVEPITKITVGDGVTYCVYKRERKLGEGKVC